jgi:DNA polymerase III subunit delta
MTQPNVYILHGDDPLAIRRQVDALVEGMGDPTTAEMNTTRLDGRQSVDDALGAAANAMPFLCERRMVILSYPFARMTTDATRKRFLALLEGLPDSTLLVLVVPDTLERGKWKSLPAVDSNWIRRWLQSAGSRASYQLCALPSLQQMAEWVRKETRGRGGQIQPDAAAALAAHVGSDTLAASQEIEKLLIYVDGKRAIEAADVEELTAQTGQGDVFAMVDALAGGNTRQALGALHRLMETQDPLSLFGMITRQFRLLIQARELLDEGRGSQLAAGLHVHPFVAEKVGGQARRFRMRQLEEIYHRLVLVDEAIKTGQMPADLALDTFIAGLAG